ncbi:hypothetical protein PG993_001283 [Apiospora rasikravindrae]|uniref:Uncharacterized protein n=1 Tax=Apiospora rasikravindrae TaxID=990691 RepID=A0ABR1UAY4_9PEZI
MAFPFHYIIRLASTSMRKQKPDAKERIAVLGFRQPARPGSQKRYRCPGLDWSDWIPPIHRKNVH